MNPFHSRWTLQCAQGVTRIRDCANVATSFPGFIALAHACGMNLDSV